MVGSALGHGMLYLGRVNEFMVTIRALQRVELNAEYSKIQRRAGGRESGPVRSR